MRKVGQSSAKGRRRVGFVANLTLDLSYLPPEQRHEVISVLNGHVTSGVRRGLIPIAMVPLVQDYIAARLDEIRRSPDPAEILPPEATRRMLELWGPMADTVFVPPQRGSSLISVSSGRILFGGPGLPHVLFQDSEALPHQQKAGYSISDFISENTETVVLEAAIEVLGLILILVGGGGAKKTVEEIAERAVRNGRVLTALKELIEFLMNYGTRGGGEGLRECINRLVQALSDAHILDDAIDAFVRGLTGWQIFMLILNLLFIFTPMGWGKKVAEILVWAAGFTYHLHHKYETWKKGKEAVKAH
jgi:hypothetical protein